MYVYTYIYKCVYVCVCIYISVCMCVCMYIYKCVYVCVYVCVCMYIYKCVYVCVCNETFTLRFSTQSSLWRAFDCNFARNLHLGTKFMGPLYVLNDDQGFNDIE